jgi:hypothetical protein
MTAKRNPETPSGAATLAPGFANAHAGYTVIAGKRTMRRQNVMWKPLARTIAVVVMFLYEPVRAEVL